MTPIRIVCSDLSDNCLGRAQVLAEVLKYFGPVAIVGPQRGATIWRPAQSSKIEIMAKQMRSSMDYMPVRNWMRRQLSGSRVVVSKPRATSLGLVLATGIRPRDLLMDIDDWELGFMELPADASPMRRARHRLVTTGDLFMPRVLNSYWSTRALEAVAQRIPRRIVSNTWLRRRFGGLLLPHVRDTDWLEPERHAEAASRRRLDYQLEARPWVAFVGTVREHKGVDDLVAALASMAGQNAPGLILAGADLKHDFTKRLVAEAERILPAERLRVVGPFDSAELPVWLGSADVLCIPSRDEPGTWGQIPAKLFDVGSSRVDLQACKLEYSIVSPK